jgi:hypothetical protein
MDKSLKQNHPTSKSSVVKSTSTVLICKELLNTNTNYLFLLLSKLNRCRCSPFADALSDILVIPADILAVFLKNEKLFFSQRIKRTYEGMA